jgi:chromosome segregation ATPase
MSDTPRTDAAETGALYGTVHCDFARTLERELATVTRERDDMGDSLEAYRIGVKHLHEELDTLTRERDALRAEVESLREVLTGIRDRDFKLSDAKRRARRALTPAEEPGPSKEWCARMADLESDSEIGAGPMANVMPAEESK